MEITLFIPGIFEFSDEIRADEIDLLSLPALGRIFSRASRSVHQYHHPESWLYQQFSKEELLPYQIPVAPITASADGLEVSDDYWLRADPVYLYPDTHSLVLQRTGNIDISENERESLLHLLKPFIEESGIGFYAPNGNRWYLRLDQDPEVVCYPPMQILGVPINDFLPTGKNQQQLRVLFNEIQMLLNQSEVNRERQDRGKLPVNSLWFWGGGYMPDIREPVFDKIYSDHPLSSALCAIGDMMHGEVKEVRSIAGEHQAICIFDDRLLEKIQLDDPGGWLEQLQSIENNIMQPLLTGIEKGEITSVRILTDKGRQFDYNKRDLRKFWRRSRPFTFWYKQ